MSDPVNSDLSTRLRRLPGQLLLALVNGTAILVILAAVLAMIATSKVTHLAQSVASTMTDAVLSQVGEDPREFVQSIQSISENVHSLTAKLARAKTEGAPGLGSEVAQLNKRLGSLEANLERLRSARANLFDELIAKVGDATADALQNFRACAPPDARAERRLTSAKSALARSEHAE
jgi:septal ring factor EnvC (AmiA/AmiB activator)